MISCLYESNQISTNDKKRIQNKRFFQENDIKIKHSGLTILVRFQYRSQKALSLILSQFATEGFLLLSIKLDGEKHYTGIDLKHFEKVSNDHFLCSPISILENSYVNTVTPILPSNLFSWLFFFSPLKLVEHKQTVN